MHVMNVFISDQKYDIALNTCFYAWRGLDRPLGHFGVKFPEYAQREISILNWWLAWS